MAQTTYDTSDHPNNLGLVAAYPDVADRGIVQKFDVFHALAQIVEYRRRAFKQRAPEFGRLDASAIAIKQPNTKRALELGD